MQEEFLYRSKPISSVCLFGFGRSNRGVFDYLKSRYPKISFHLRSDKTEMPECPDKFDGLHLGETAIKGIFEDILFISPAVRRDRECFLEYEKRGGIISSDAELFFELYGGEKYAVTGSDGKSTTTALISAFLSEGGSECPAAGNIGKGLSGFIDSEYKRVAVELSSFQLMGAAPSTTRAIITNISENHLDYHTSYDEYIGAKFKIFDKCREPIFNLDDNLIRNYAEGRRCFAAYSAYMTESELMRITKAENYITLKNRSILVNGRFLFDTDVFSLKEEHNLKNLLSATAVCLHKTTAERMAAAARDFAPLPHRCRLAHRVNGISFYDSSIDSTPKRTVTTLSEFGDNTVIILGGQGKGLGYRELIPHLVRLSGIVICGKNRFEIFNTLTESGLYDKKPPVLCDNLRDAVFIAAEMARPGDSVLLSPASTSFDAFADYGARGDEFQKSARAIPPRQ